MEGAEWPAPSFRGAGSARAAQRRAVLCSRRAGSAGEPRWGCRSARPGLCCFLMRCPCALRQPYLGAGAPSQPGPQRCSRYRVFKAVKRSLGLCWWDAAVMDWQGTRGDCTGDTGIAIHLLPGPVWCPQGPPGPVSVERGETPECHWPSCATCNGQMSPVKTPFELQDSSAGNKWPDKSAGMTQVVKPSQKVNGHWDEPCKSWAGSNSASIKTISEQNKGNIKVKWNVNVDRSLEVVDQCTVLLVMRYFITFTLF